jgi:hypothetical protein
MGYEVPILFPELMDHDYLFSRESVLAAGFCSIEGQMSTIEIDGVVHEDINVYCYGKSITLGKESRGSTDADLIKKTIYNGL